MMVHCCIDSSSSSSCRCGEEDRLQQRPLVLDAVRTWFGVLCCCMLSPNEESVEKVRYI